jgi:chemotaxis protein histidine kinase CheA
VHTLKGNAGSYDVVELVDAAHQVEAATSIDLVQLAVLETTLHAFLERHREILGVDFAGGYVFEVPEQRARALRAMADRASVPAQIRRWAAELPLKPVNDLIGPVPQMVERLAEGLRKQVSLEIAGGDVLVDAVVVAPIIAVLSHLLRNAVCHGIELPALRRPKPERGHLTLRASETEREWQLVVQDDGAGIDVDRVVSRAIELGAITCEQARTLDLGAKLELISVDGLSTAREITTISGRGVGLSAVQGAVKHAGGYLRVETELGSFTRITIHLPKPESLCDAALMLASPRGPSAAALPTTLR